MEPRSLQTITRRALLLAEPALADVLRHVDNFDDLPEFIRECWAIRPTYEIQNPEEDLNDPCRAVLLLHEQLSDEFPGEWDWLSRHIAMGFASAFDPNDAAVDVLTETWRLYLHDESVLGLWRQLFQEVSEARYAMHRTVACPSRLTMLITSSWFDELSPLIPSMRMLRERRIVYPEPKYDSDVSYSDVSF